MLFYKHNQHIVPDTCYVPDMKKITTFFSEISQQPLKMYEKYAHNLVKLVTEPKSILCTSTTHGIPDHGTQYEGMHPAIMEECARMTRQMDRLMD